MGGSTLSLSPSLTGVSMPFEGVDVAPVQEHAGLHAPVLAEDAGAHARLDGDGLVDDLADRGGLALDLRSPVGVVMPTGSLT